MCFGGQSGTPQAKTNPAPFPLEDAWKAVETERTVPGELPKDDNLGARRPTGQTGQAPKGPSGITRPRM